MQKYLGWRNVNFVTEKSDKRQENHALSSSLTHFLELRFPKWGLKNEGVSFPRLTSVSVVHRWMWVDELESQVPGRRVWEPIIGMLRMCFLHVKS